MDTLSTQEQQWLSEMRQLRERLYVGIDHHGAQFTVAVASGDEIQGHAGHRSGFAWVKARVFSQDGDGYEALLDYLAEAYPEISREHYRFLSEPSYAKPCSHFLLNAGLQADQVLWVDSRKVAQYRKSHHLTHAGKNDADDARIMVAMLYGAASNPAGPLRLFQVPSFNPTAEALSGLAEEHQRLTSQRVQLQGKIFQKVLLLFPEARQIWSREESAKKPDGSEYTRKRLALFNSKTPLRVLHAFPSARHLAEAGFDGVWACVGRSGLCKGTIRELVRVAQASAGIANTLWSRQLQLLIEEYWEINRRLESYETEMGAICSENEVLASLTNLRFLPIQGLAAIIGAMGDVVVDGKSGVGPDPLREQAAA